MLTTTTNLVRSEVLRQPQADTLYNHHRTQLTNRRRRQHVNAQYVYCAIYSESIAR